MCAYIDELSMGTSVTVEYILLPIVRMLMRVSGRRRSQ